MRMRLLLLTVGLLMAAVLVAGCGDDEEGGGGGGGTAAPTVTETTTEGSGGGDGATNPQSEQAVESCKQRIDEQPGVSEELRADLEAICEKAASGDEQEARRATEEVCRRIIEENVPEGPARDQALASCDQAAPR